ncbi:hypothetical protein [Adhaeretor mobilis]|nr:hypothetical protein [Adhaeretor mobilis]
MSKWPYLAITGNSTRRHSLGVGSELTYQELDVQAALVTDP